MKIATALAMFRARVVVEQVAMKMGVGELYENTSVHLIQFDSILFMNILCLLLLILFINGTVSVLLGCNTIQQHKIQCNTKLYYIIHICLKFIEDENNEGGKRTRTTTREQRGGEE